MPDYGIKKNAEGYPDPTAAAGMSRVIREENASQWRVNTLIASIKGFLAVSDFELVGRIVIRDKKTGREYR